MNKNLEKDIARYVHLQKNIMNEKRFMLLHLLYTESATWSKLMRMLNIYNPKLLADHLNILTSLKLIEKNNDGYYVITDSGKVVWETNSLEMKKILEAVNKK